MLIVEYDRRKDTAAELLPHINVYILQLWAKSRTVRVVRLSLFTAWLYGMLCRFMDRVSASAMNSLRTNGPHPYIQRERARRMYSLEQCVPACNGV